MSIVAPQGSEDGGPSLYRVFAMPSRTDAFAYIPDGRRVVICCGRTMKVWNLEKSRQEGKSMEHDSRVFNLEVTQDGKNIVSGDMIGNIKVWDVESQEVVKRWAHLDGDLPIVISPCGRLIAAGCRTVFIYAAEGGWQIKQSIEVGERCWCMAFTPNGDKLACGTAGGDILVYGVNSGALVLDPIEGHEDWISSVVWSRDGYRLFSCSRDKTIRCWNSVTGEQIGQPWTGHTSSIRSLALSPGGAILASASPDRTIRFWETTTGNPIGQPLLHDGGYLSRVLFSPCGEFVASQTSHGRKIYVWRVPRSGTPNASRTCIDHSLSTLSQGQAAPIGESLPQAFPPPYTTHLSGAEYWLDFGPHVSDYESRSATCLLMLPQGIHTCHDHHSNCFVAQVDPCPSYPGTKYR